MYYILQRPSIGPSSSRSHRCIRSNRAVEPAHLQRAKIPRDSHSTGMAPAGRIDKFELVLHLTIMKEIISLILLSRCCWRFCQPLRMLVPSTVRRLTVDVASPRHAASMLSTLRALPPCRRAAVPSSRRAAVRRRVAVSPSRHGAVLPCCCATVLPCCRTACATMLPCHNTAILPKTIVPLYRRVATTVQLPPCHRSNCRNYSRRHHHICVFCVASDTAASSLAFATTDGSTRRRA